MSFRDSLRRVAHSVRAIPDKLGCRTYTVAVVTNLSGGAEPGQGSQTTTTTAITEAGGAPPRVRWLSNEELAVGGYESAMVQIGPVTPDFPGGGTLLSTLAPTPPVNTSVRVVLTGPRYPAGANFEIVEVKHDRAFGYKLICKRSS